MSCEKKTGGCCQQMDYLICTCMGVMRSDIEEAIDNGIQTFDALSDELGVGTGCSSCVQEVNDILAEKVSK